MVGAGRGDTTDSGNGGELYTVIGQAPRHLDRNVTLVGRIVRGVEILSVMPRGTGALGFYETAPERTQISSVRMAADVPPAERVNLEALKTDSATFATLVDLAADAQRRLVRLADRPHQCLQCAASRARQEVGRRKNGNARDLSRASRGPPSALRISAWSRSLWSCGSSPRHNP